MAWAAAEDRVVAEPVAAEPAGVAAPAPAPEEAVERAVPACGNRCLGLAEAVVAPALAAEAWEVEVVTVVEAELAVE